MHTAVVGHVEWVEFARVESVPSAGEIVHAHETWAEAAGGGGVAAAQLLKLAGAATLYTAFAADDLGGRARAELEGRGVRIEAAVRPPPQRRAFTFVDRVGERTITVMGERHSPRGGDPLPWSELASVDAVYFVSGDAEAVRAARQARILVATARTLPSLAEAGVLLDALVHSGSDEGERYRPGDIDPPPRLVVTTAGREGGSYVAEEGRTGSYAAAPAPGPVVDAYGAGDSFAAGLTYALAAAQDIEAALAFAARCGSACLTGRGGYEGQLRLTP